MALSAHARITETRVLHAVIQFRNFGTTNTASTQPSVNRTHVTAYMYWVTLSFRQVPKANARKLHLYDWLLQVTYPATPRLRLRSHCIRIWPILTCICLMAGGLLVKTWRQSHTRRDVRALHDVTSDMSHERHDFITWLFHANAHPASRISQYENSHPVRCFWILLEFCNTIVRVRSRVIRDMIIEL